MGGGRADGARRDEGMGERRASEEGKGERKGASGRSERGWPGEGAERSERSSGDHGREASERGSGGGRREGGERADGVSGDGREASWDGREASWEGRGREGKERGGGRTWKEGGSRRAPAPARSSYLQIKIIQHESNTIGRGGEARREGRALGAQRLSRFRALSLSRSLIC